MRKILRMKCPFCGCWNRFPVDKVFVEQHVSDPKIKAFIPMYKPLELIRCKKCGEIIGNPNELIRIVKLSAKA